MGKALGVLGLGSDAGGVNRWMWGKVCLVAGFLMAE